VPTVASQATPSRAWPEPRRSSCSAEYARLRDRVAADPALELVDPTPWSLVCFRARAGDPATEAILARVNASGTAFMSHTKVDGRTVARVSVGAPGVAERHVDALWDLIRGAR